MKTYSLPEFTLLLKLGLWTGGEVVGTGYLSAVDRVTGNGITAGLTGIELGCGVRLEKYDRYGTDGTVLIISVYEPYQGEFSFRSVKAAYMENPLEVFRREQEVASQKETVKWKSKAGRFASPGSRSKYLDRRNINARLGKIHV